MPIGLCQLKVRKITSDAWHDRSVQRPFGSRPSKTALIVRLAQHRSRHRKLCPGEYWMEKYTFRVNGRTATVESWDPGQPLLYLLRNSLGLHGPKFGCGLAQCGACTVLIDGKAARSCVTPVKQAVNHAITTRSE